MGSILSFFLLCFVSPRIWRHCSQVQLFTGIWATQKGGFRAVSPSFGCDPPDLAEESKPSPAQKVKEESLGESLGESPRVPADPPKRVKNESPEPKKQLIFDSQSLQKTRF